MKMKGNDTILPFLLRRENIARYENGKVIIGNRKEYPFKKTFVVCDDIEEVGTAIKQMITQGGGQWVAAGYGLAMEAGKWKKQTPGEQLEQLQQAAHYLISMRPTNTTLAVRLGSLLESIAVEAQGPGEKSLEDFIVEWVNHKVDEDYTDFETMGRLGMNLIQSGDGILTMCFAEMSFLYTLIFAREAGKEIKVYVPETRPYLQGARLTAPSIHELGIPVELICDNMPAYMLSQGKIQKYFTAADLVTLDGYVVNKIGTFQNAICAHYHKVPYFAFCRNPDASRTDFTCIEIEERDPGEIKSFKGMATTLEEINASYPAFDITPPHLVSAVITAKGIINPYNIRMHIS